MKETKFSTGGGIKSAFSVLPKLTAKEAVDALCKWEGMNPTIAILQSVMENEGIVSTRSSFINACVYQYIESLWSLMLSYCLLGSSPYSS